MLPVTACNLAIMGAPSAHLAMSPVSHPLAIFILILLYLAAQSHAFYTRCSADTTVFVGLYCTLLWMLIVMQPTLPQACQVSSTSACRSKQPCTVPRCRSFFVRNALRHAVRTHAYQKPVKLPNTYPCVNDVCICFTLVAASAGALAVPSLLIAGGLSVEVSGNIWTSGTQLALGNSTTTPASAQIFRSSDTPQTLMIKTVNNNTLGGEMCLDVAGTAAGTKVQIYTCSASASAQRWAVDSKGRLHSRNVALLAAPMCLDAVGSRLTVGTKLVINPCSSAPSQIFAPLAAGESRIRPAAVSS